MKTPPTASQTKLLDRIARALRPRIGRENAITARDLAAEVDSNERDVRRVISKHGDYLWAKDVAVVSAIRHGFYCSDDAEGFQQKRDYLVAFGLSIAEQIASLDRLCGSRGIRLQGAKR